MALPALFQTISKAFYKHAFNSSIVGMSKKFKFIDLFAGIGGFHHAMHGLGGKCVFASEIDKHARKTYTENFKGISKQIFKGANFNEDITKINPSNIPDFDVLCAGFPCQPFSQAGYKKGFKDHRGNLFFNIANIIEHKKPKAYFLENVRGLYKHDNGKTFKVIHDVLSNMGYSVNHKIVNASDYGLPQHRSRIFIIGFKDDSLSSGFNFPEKIPLKYNMSDVMEGKCNKEIGFTLRCGGRGSPISDRRNWDSYMVDGEVVRLNPTQGLKMQGFPSEFIFPVTENQAMKQLGNSVAIDAIQTCGKAMVDYMNNFALAPSGIY